jgi:hypothetical protein
MDQRGKDPGQAKRKEKKIPDDVIGINPLT